MSVSVSQVATKRVSIVRPLAWVGIIGAAVALVFAAIELVSPSKVGRKLVNPSLAESENLLFPISFIGWVLICFAFYLSGATGRGGLAKIAIAIAVVGAIVSSVSSVVTPATGDNADMPDWVGLVQLGLVFVAPILLGIAALRARVANKWQALYPILVVAILSIVFWGAFGDSAVVPIIVQALAWIGLGALSMGIERRAA